MKSEREREIELPAENNANPTQKHEFKIVILWFSICIPLLNGVYRVFVVVVIVRKVVMVVVFLWMENSLGWFHLPKCWCWFSRILFDYNVFFFVCDKEKKRICVRFSQANSVKTQWRCKQQFYIVIEDNTNRMKHTFFSIFVKIQWTLNGQKSERFENRVKHFEFSL